MNKTLNKGKIFFITVFVLLFIFIASSFVILKIGFTIESFSIGGMSINELSVKLKRKLHFNITEVTLSQLTPSSKPKTSPPNLEKIIKNIKRLHVLKSIISSFVVENIRMENGKGSGAAKYGEKDGTSQFFYNSPTINVNIETHLYNDIITVSIHELEVEKYISNGEGEIQVSLAEKEFSGSISAELADHSVPISMRFNGDQKKITFEGSESGAITTITPLVDIFGLSHNIQRWITDYLEGSRYILESFSGTIPWDKPAEILNTLKAEVRVVEGQYIFAPKLKEPIKSKFIDVSFADGVLTILPEDATFFGQSGGASWLDINFTDPANILLTAYIKTKAILNDDIHRLLNNYSINLPFDQTTGITDTDLTLAITLNKLKIIASGTFAVDSGTIRYKDVSYGTKNLNVKINNSNVTIDSLDLSLKDMMSASVTGNIMGEKKTGNLTITLTKFTKKIGEHNLGLDSSEPPLIIDYHINKSQQRFDARASHWSYGDKKITIAPISAPFSPADFSTTLPQTSFAITPGFSATVGGSVSIQNKLVNLEGALLSLGNEIIHLQDQVPFSFKLDDLIHFQTHTKSLWQFKANNILLGPIDITYNDQKLSIFDTNVQIDNFFSSDLSGNYTTDSREGILLFHGLHLNEKHIGSLLNIESGLPVEFTLNPEKFILSITPLTFVLTQSQDQWKAELDDFTTISAFSPTLKHFLPSGGRLELSGKKNTKDLSFHAEIISNPPILTNNGSPIDRLLVDGKHSPEGGFQANINESIQIDYNKQLSIKSNDIGLIVPELITLFNTRPKKKKLEMKAPEEHSFHFSYKGTNSPLYFSKNTELLADEVTITTLNGETKLNLKHGDGVINFKGTPDNFTMEGNGFSGTFIQSLIKGTALEGGSLSLAASGSYEKYSALLSIEDLLIKDFAPINNTLALMNTIPALVTFSLPEYNLKGLPVSSSVVGFAKEGDTLTIESFTMESPVFSMTGLGVVDTNLDEIDLEFNLISQAKNNTSKIPLLGYVLVGDEEHPSIRLTVSGKLSDPLVEHNTYSKVARLPISILQNTIMLPKHLFDAATNSEEETTE